MDGTTEPLIAVIGHPIAGNPTQFALECALEAMNLEWRVLSFDVAPENVAAAIEGFAVTGIVGVMVDPTILPAAASWYREKKGLDPQVDASIDCLYRDEALQFQGSFEQREWVDQLIADHQRDHSDQEQLKVWLGDREPGLPISSQEFPVHQEPVPPDPDAIAKAGIIVISTTRDNEPLALEMEEWPADDGSTLVIDLTDGHPHRPTIEQLGYRVVATHQRKVGTLERCLLRWSGSEPAADVIHDAIEEYLGV